MSEVLEARPQVLMALSRALSASLDMDEALGAVVRAAAEIATPSLVSFWAADERTATLTLAAVSDQDAFADFPVKTLRIGQGIVGEVARTRRPLRIPDVCADDRIVFAEWSRAHGLRSLDGLPVLFQDSVLGVLACSRSVPLADDDDAHGVLAFFADQAALIIRNAERIEALLEVNRQLSSRSSRPSSG
jgi:GAF domain-containing protein